MMTNKYKEYFLHELLAILHGDGGHYTIEHGMHKSCRDAVKIAKQLKEMKKTLTEQKTYRVNIVNLDTHIC